MLALIILCILFTWLLCAAVCIGIGSLLLRAFSFASQSSPLDGAVQTLSRTSQNDSTPPIVQPCNLATFQRFSLLHSFWTGIAIIQLYHFFRPIDLVAVYLLLGLALAGWIWNRTSLLRFSGVSAVKRSNDLPRSSGGSTFRLSTFSFQLSTLLLLSLAAAIIAFRCAALGEHYDTGLYGAQAVRWFITCPLVPGLGNLLGQFGFNSSVFLWIAALDQGPWRGFAHHLFDGFLIAALFASIIPAALRVFRAKRISPIDWFFTLLFVPATIWGATSKIVGTNTDLPTSVVCLVAAAILFRALDEESPHPATGTSDTPRIGLVIAMVLFSLAVTFKISSLVFASLGWAVAVLKLWSLRRTAPQVKRQLVWAVILSAVIVLPWMGRGLVMTGYPFFPSTAFSIPVDWKVPAFETQLQADFARSFARVPGLTYEYAHGWHWLRPWFRELVRERRILDSTFFCAGGHCGGNHSNRTRRSESASALALASPSFGGRLDFLVFRSASNAFR